MSAKKDSRGARLAPRHGDRERSEARDVWPGSWPCATLVRSAQAKETGLKGSQKPKTAQKKPAQKTLKERRSAKKAAAKIRGIAE